MALLKQSATGNRQFSYRFLGLLLCVITWLPLGSDAYGDIFIMNASLINTICTSSCDDTRNTQVLLSDCYRGCRFFDLLNKDSVFSPFDDISALESCNRSCSEAYANETLAEEACKEGCAVAQREYHSILTLSLHWLREIQRNRTFFETLLEITSAIVFPSSNKIDAGQFIEEVPSRKGSPTRRMHLKIKPILRPGDSLNHNKTFIAEVTRESYSLPEWIPLSALALSTVGTILTIGVCCYCCLFANIMKEAPNKSIDSDSPPSYEQLLRNGLLPPNRSDQANIKTDKPQDQTDGRATETEVTQQPDHHVVFNLESAAEVHETQVLLTVRA